MESIRKLIGKTINELRGKRSQRSVAYVADVPTGTWCQWETGKRLPRDAQFEKILFGLNCTEEDFLATFWRLQGEVFKRRGSELGKVALEALATYQQPTTDYQKMVEAQSLRFRDVPDPCLPVLLRLEQKLGGLEADFEALIVAMESCQE